MSSTEWKRTFFTIRSSANIMMPPTISAMATISGVCIAARMASYAITPMSKAGTKPSRMLRVNAIGPGCAFNKPVPTAQKRCQYTSNTANIAPSWMAILNAIELLSVNPTSSPASIRCPVDDTGRNSVSPSIMPRRTAISQSLTDRLQSDHAGDRCSTSQRQLYRAAWVRCRKPPARLCRLRHCHCPASYIDLP